MSRLPRYRFEGGTALVTGAASGIGAALAAGLAARGSHLELLDRDEEGLAAVADTLRSVHPGVRVVARAVDLRDRAATAETLQPLLAGSPRPSLVVNNAGVALAGRFEEQSLEDVDWLLDVNLRATVAVAHHLLPALLAAPGSHLVNLSSVFGLVAPPGQVAYATSKFAVRGFSDALGAELAGRVGLTCVHPGGVATAIARGARIGAGTDPAAAAREAASFERFLSIPPERAAAAILRGVERRSARVLVGAAATLPDLAARLAPTGHRALLERLTRHAGGVTGERSSRWGGLRPRGPGRR